MKHAILTDNNSEGVIQIIGTFVQGKDMIISIKEYEKIKERHENIQKLKSHILYLEKELKNYKKTVQDGINNMFVEHSESKVLKSEISSLKETINTLTEQNNTLKKVNRNLSKKVEKLEKQQSSNKIDKELLIYLKTNYPI